MREQVSELKELGLGEGEAKTYVALVELGRASVADVQKRTGIHRTTIYEYLNKLEEKGLSSQSVIGGKTYYFATETSNLVRYVKHKEELAEYVANKLGELSCRTSALSVDVLAGNNGLRMLLTDTLKHGERGILWIGVNESLFASAFPQRFIQHINRKKKEKGIEEKVLAHFSTGQVFTYAECRTLSKEILPPVPVCTYSSYVAYIIWEPKAVIVMNNEYMVEEYRQYFEKMWKEAICAP